MAAGPPYPPLVAVATGILDAEAADHESSDAVKTCGRCRLDFARHPSIDLDESARWWLCPTCRIRLLGDASRTNSRWK